MFNISQFRELIVKSSLDDLLFYSKDVEELLIFTCANESLGGTYLHQAKGPALGIFQMEPSTYNDLWQNFINNNHSLLLRISSNFDHNVHNEARLIYDLRFATAMAACFYMRIRKPFPAYDDVNGIWEFYKLHYNTMKGAATKDTAIANYHRFLGR